MIIGLFKTIPKEGLNNWATLLIKIGLMSALSYIIYMENVFMCSIL